MSGFVDARTLIPRTPPEEVLENIVRAIVERVRPRRIILIGSRARGDARPDSDYDVVVEMHSEIQDRHDFVREIYGCFGAGKGWSLNLFPRVAGEIERAADDPGTVDWDIVRQGKVLYAAKDISAALTVPAPRYVREKPKDAPPSVRSWEGRAEADLEQARRSASMGDSWSYVCFFSQQAAEKYLKALLVRNLVRPQWIHDLERLLKDARAAGPRLPGLNADCELLTPFAIDARYRDLESFDEAKGRAALAAAERIAAAIAPLL